MVTFLHLLIRTTSGIQCYGLLVCLNLETCLLSVFFFYCALRGVLPRKKPELLCVLEQKQRQKKNQELALHPPSDLEVKLRIRQQRMQFVSTQIFLKKKKKDAGNSTIMRILFEYLHAN